MWVPVAILCVAVLLPGLQARSMEDWQGRTIYQVVTDRFAQTVDSFSPCNNLQDYCGGTFQGISASAHGSKSWRIVWSFACFPIIHPYIILLRTHFSTRRAPPFVLS
jgi:hypothetical protein